MFKPFRCVLALLIAAGPVAALAGDYSIEAGDTVDISVIGVPALHRQGKVGLDGKISFPLLGDIVAAGRSRAQLQGEVSRLLAERNVASRPDVAVEVTEYRPIYVDGDVAKPGEYPYRPGMTVRNAVAVAGGLGLLEGGGVGPLMDAAAARGEVGAIVVDLATKRAQLARLKAELADQATFTVSQSPDAPLDQRAFDDIVRTETEQLAADRDNRQREKAYLDQMIQASQRELDYLNNASQQQQKAFEQQTSDVARARDLLQRGIGTMIRTEDEQRAISLLNWQILDVKARVQQAQKELQTYTQQAQTYDDKERIRLLEVSQATAADIGKLGHRLNAARDRVRLGTGARLKRDGFPETAIYRPTHGAQQRIDADQDTALLPGDVVETTVRAPGTPLAMRADKP